MYVVHSYGDPGATQGGHSGDPGVTHKQQVSSPEKGSALPLLLILRSIINRISRFNTGINSPEFFWNIGRDMTLHF